MTEVKKVSRQTMRISRRSLLNGAAVSLLAFGISPAGARFPRGSVANTAPTGKTLIGATEFDYNSGPFLNQFSANTQLTCASPSDFGSTTSNFTADGYPVNGVSFSNSVQTQCVLAPWLKTTDQFYISWTGALGLQLAWGVVATVISGGSFVTSNNGTFEIQGTNGLIILTLPSIPSGQFPCYWYQNGGTHYTFSGASNLQFGRYATAANYPTSGSRYTDQATLTNLTNPSQLYSPDYINVLKAYNPRVYRPMPVAGFNNSMCLSRSSYKTNWNTGFAILSGFTIPSVWAGAIADSSDAYSVSAPPGWAGLVDGATVQGYISSSNTTVAPTLNVGATGNIQIVGFTFPDGIADPFFKQNSRISPGNMVTNVPATFVYSAPLNLWFYTQGMFNDALPIELRVGLCNLVNCDYFHSYPHQYDNASVTAEATYIAGNLNAQLRSIHEDSNEIWNLFFNQYYYFSALGQVYGFAQSNFSYHGLRSQQVMSLVSTAFGARSTVRGMGAQAFGDQIDTQLYQLNGTEVASGISARTQISAITLGTTTTIQTATPHGLSNGNTVFLGGGTYSTINPAIVGAISVNATFNISASTSPTLQSLTGTGFTIEIWNQSAVNAFFVLGGNTAAANATSFKIPAGAKIQIPNNGQGSISVVLASGTGTVTVYQGSDFNTNSYTATVVDTTHFTIPVNSTGWQAYVSGGTVYKVPTTGSRPMDAHNCGFYATYWIGGIYGNEGLYGDPTSLAASSMITDCLNFSNGTSGQKTTALSNFDTDIRTNGDDCLAAYVTLYPQWQTIFSSYSAIIINYEGGPQLQSPSTTQLTNANGGVAPNGTTFPTQAQFVTFFEAWLNSSLAYATARKQINDAFAAGVDTPGTYIFGQGGDPSQSLAAWNQRPGTFFSPAPYQVWQGLADLNNGI